MTNYVQTAIRSISIPLPFFPFSIVIGHLLGRGSAQTTALAPFVFQNGLTIDLNVKVPASFKKRKIHLQKQKTNPGQPPAMMTPPSCAIPSTLV